LAACPRFLNENVGRDISDLTDDVQFAKPIQPLAFVGVGGELGLVVMSDLANGM
jgi:hypothetical protein